MKFDDPPVKAKNDPMPLVWTKTYKGDDGKGRVVTSTLGA
jgi:hypothetical protein